MSNLESRVATFEADVETTHDIVHGDDTTEVATDNGPVRSFAKLQKDLVEDLNAADTIAETQQHRDQAQLEDVAHVGQPEGHAGEHQDQAQRGRLAGRVHPGEHVVEAVQAHGGEQREQRADAHEDGADQVHVGSPLWWGAPEFRALVMLELLVAPRSGPP